MIMHRYIVVNQYNKVVNIIQWDGKTPWEPPKGCRAIRSDFYNIGDTYSD